MTCISNRLINFENENKQRNGIITQGLWVRNLLGTRKKPSTRKATGNHLIKPPSKNTIGALFWFRLSSESTILRTSFKTSNLFLRLLGHSAVKTKRTPHYCLIFVSPFRCASSVSDKMAFSRTTQTYGRQGRESAKIAINAQSLVSLNQSYLKRCSRIYHLKAAVLNLSCPADRFNVRQYFQGPALKVWQINTTK